MVTTDAEKTKPNPESDPPQCLIHLVEKASSTLNGQEKWIFGHLLLNYKNVFVLDEADLGRNYLVRHKIETNDHFPIKQSPRRIPMGEKSDTRCSEKRRYRAIHKPLEFSCRTGY